MIGTSKHWYKELQSDDFSPLSSDPYEESVVDWRLGLEVNIRGENSSLLKYVCMIKCYWKLP